MGSVLFGTSLLASFLGGMVALFAPCCVSVMLPAYLATGMRKRAGILAATLVFAAGVATVIVPIGMGASAITALVSGHHFVVFLIGGVLMALGGVAVLSGWSPRLPMPGGRAPSGSGWAATYGLGLFSGAASSCCAPVLAGVAVLSGAAASFPAALAVSLTYVAGMTVPLCLLALLWDRGDGRAARVLHRRELRLQIGSRSRTLSFGTLASGLLMIAMGGLTIVIAFTGPAMNSGWQVRAGAWLDHLASVATGHLDFLPGWALLVLLAVFAVLVVRRLRRAPRSDRLAGPELPAAAPCCAPNPLTTVAASGRADVDE